MECLAIGQIRLPATRRRTSLSGCQPKQAARAPPAPAAPVVGGWKHLKNTRSLTSPIRVYSHLHAVASSGLRLVKLLGIVVSVIGLVASASRPADAQASQSVEFSAPFASLSQNAVTYGQGIVADSSSNLYITGTVNLLYLQRNSDGSYTPASTKIDSEGGTAYGLAIDAANNLYRPDIAPGSYPALAKYVYPL
jgi:hypothetical protein